MPYKSRAQKEADRRAHAHWNARWSARFAEEARVAGNLKRAAVHYEWALNHEIDALNECLQSEQCDTDAIRQLYENVLFYAQSCGRHKKAERLQASAERWEREQARECETEPN